MEKLTIEFSAKAGGDTVKFKSDAVEADQLIKLSRDNIEPLQAVTFNIAFPFADLKGFAIGCKNSTGTTGEGQATFTVVPKTTAAAAASTPATMTITPKIGKGWSAGDVLNDVNPFTAAVATILVTNTGDKRGDFYGFFLVDSTPATPG